MSSDKIFPPVLRSSIMHQKHALFNVAVSHFTYDLGKDIGKCHPHNLKLPTTLLFTEIALYLLS